MLIENRTYLFSWRQKENLVVFFLMSRAMTKDRCLASGANTKNGINHWQEEQKLIKSSEKTEINRTTIGGTNMSNRKPTPQKQKAQHADSDKKGELTTAWWFVKDFRKWDPRRFDNFGGFIPIFVSNNNTLLPTLQFRIPFTGEPFSPRSMICKIMQLAPA